MSLVRWRRPHDLPAVFDEMDRMFNRFLRSPLVRWGDEEPIDFGPAIDVYETETDVVVKAELPGVKKEDIDLTVQDDRLIIQGQSRQEEEVKEEGYHRKEIRTGSFRRVVAFPTAVNTEALTAKFDNGILTVTAPKTAETPKGTKVPIE
ncbi:MAG: Hsp20/alpha crystallin family protein [Armatimonadetes bacterium]|nr:Hsp20/alpha crystallin family protein [Armatimonadota bacterium]